MNSPFKDYIQREFLKTGFHAVCYIGTVPRLVQIETCFFGIIHCMYSTFGEKKLPDFIGQKIIGTFLLQTEIQLFNKNKNVQVMQNS